MVKKVFLILAILIFQKGNSQTTFEVPANLDFTTDSCHTHDDVIVKAAKWLEETDVDSGKEKRKEVNKLIFSWLTDCAYMSAPLNDNLAKIYGRNYQLLGIFMARFARHTIENKDSLSGYKATEAGLHAMIASYKKSTGIKKSKEMENLISIVGKNLLEYYIFQKFEIRKGE